MKDKIFIALGKAGDILSVLPILYQEFKVTKKPPKLLVSSKYASVLNCVSYVDPRIWAGDFFDLSAAVKLVKGMGMDAVLLQVFGRDWPFMKRTPSFQLEQWDRAGALEYFYDWPLMIDRRNRNRERDIISKMGNRPFILVADYSESSPLPGKNRLVDVISNRFGDTHSVIQLSSIRATALTDFVGLYERASALVSIETSHLHLSRAVKRPMVALTTDIPSRWHGSAWHPRMQLQCRYSDLALREEELSRAISQVINGDSGIDSTEIPTHFPNGYNPTVVEGMDMMIYRYHPDKSWRTRLAIGGQTIMFPPRFDDFSHEDAKLFYFREKLHVAVVMAMAEFDTWKCVVVYGPLVNTPEGGLAVPSVFIPKYGNNNFGSLEKNWVFFEHEDRLYFVYETSGSNQVVVEVENERCPAVLHSRSWSWKYGPIRGGCIIPWKGQLLRFFHSHTSSGHRDSWIYVIGALVMENKPPFAIRAISQLPIISGTERFIPSCLHWKANVAFPGGVQKEDEGWKLFYGLNDCRCMSAHLNERDLNLVSI